MSQSSIQYNEHYILTHTIEQSQKLNNPEFEWTCLVSASLTESAPSLTKATLEMIGFHTSELMTALFEEIVKTEKKHWFFNTHKNGIQVVSVTISLVNNDEIAILNHQYRDKNKATDVLSFPGIDADSVELVHVPEIDLGEIYISLPWAAQETKQSLDVSGCISSEYKLFVCDRILHGLLHVLGKHHDTIEEYNWVRGTQDKVLSRVFSLGSELKK